MQHGIQKVTVSTQHPCYDPLSSASWLSFEERKYYHQAELRYNSKETGCSKFGWAYQELAQAPSISLYEALSEHTIIDRLEDINNVTFQKVYALSASSEA